MCDGEAKEAEELTSVRNELEVIWNALSRLGSRLPGLKRTLEKLSGGTSTESMKALTSRLQLYRTQNTIKEAEQISSASGLPVPVVLDHLSRQRNIDSIAIRAMEKIIDDPDTPTKIDTHSRRTEDRWFNVFRDEAGNIEEDDLREVFSRILAGEIQSPGLFSIRTLRIAGSMSERTATHFRRAVSVCVALYTVNHEIVLDARIPDAGGSLGQNCLSEEGLSYIVLTELTENELLDPDYNSWREYGPILTGNNIPISNQPLIQFPFAHQGKYWKIVPKANDNPSQIKPFRVSGAKLTSWGTELLRIVDIEPLPKFTKKLENHFLGNGYTLIEVDD